MSATATLYPSLILERSRHPRHHRRLEGAPCCATRRNALCGDEVAVALRLGAEGRIAEGGFTGEGCAILLAASDLMLDAVQGLTPDSARALGEAFGAMIVGRAAIPQGSSDGGSILSGSALACFAPLAAYPGRRRCAVLPWEALAAALAPAMAPPKSSRCHERARPPASSGHGAWTPEGETPPQPSEDAVIAAIATVYDPEIPVNIYELGLIYVIDISDHGAVRVEMTLTAPGCPSAQELPVMVRDALRALPGVTAAEVVTVWEPPWTPERMSEDARLALNMF